jgi:hypothetical protein
VKNETAKGCFTVPNSRLRHTFERGMPHLSRGTRYRISIVNLVGTRIQYRLFFKLYKLYLISPWRYSYIEEPFFFLNGFRPVIKLDR